MAKLNKTRTIAAALLGTAVLGTPMTSFAQDYRTNSRGYIECKQDDKDNQLVGGLLGAVAGGVIGSQVAGRGERTEASVIGAAIGAAAGAGIGDDRRNCSREAGVRTVRTSGRNIGTTYAAPPVYSGRTVTTTRYANDGFRNRGFNNRNSRFGDRGFNRRNVSYGYNDRIERRLYQIDREIHAANIKIDELKYKKDVLKDKRRYAHDTYRIERRLRAIDRQIHDLKDCKRDLKREARRLRNNHY